MRKFAGERWWKNVIIKFLKEFFLSNVLFKVLAYFKKSKILLLSNFKNFFIPRIGFKYFPTYFSLSSKTALKQGEAEKN